jgi:hypothetical protein
MFSTICAITASDWQSIQRLLIQATLLAAREHIETALFQFAGLGRLPDL